MNLKFSIVTPCYNSGDYLEEMISSVSSQTYRNYEHIIVDAGSSDATISILKRYPHLDWKSEKDKGQSDAINKGFRKATGDILAWQNADDLYFPDTLEAVAAYFQKHPNVDMVYGGYQQIDPSGNWICDVHSRDWNPWLFKHGRFAPVQPTVFWRRGMYEAVGELDLGLNYCMDIDFYSRALNKGYRFARLPRMLGKFRVHNDSKTQNPLNERNVYNEYRKVLSGNFSFNAFDYMLFDAFYYRSRLTARLKSRWFKRI